MRIRPRKPHSAAIGEGTKSFNNVQQRFTHFVFVGQRFLDPRPATGAETRQAYSLRRTVDSLRGGAAAAAARGSPVVARTPPPTQHLTLTSLASTIAPSPAPAPTMGGRRVSGSTVVAGKRATSSGAGLR